MSVYTEFASSSSPMIQGAPYFFKYFDWYVIHLWSLSSGWTIYHVGQLLIVTVDLNSLHALVSNAILDVVGAMMRNGAL